MGGTAIEGSLLDTLSAYGLSRRSFLKYCTALTAAMALPARFTTRVAQALAAVDKPSIVWLEFQDCAGNTESFLRSRNPSVADLVLDLLSIDYHETIMAAAGEQAEAARDAAVRKGGHLVVVEGSIPFGADGAYCTIGGKSSIQLLREASRGAAAVVTVGTCASYGGIPAAVPNPTGAVGVSDVVKDVPIVNLPGCPVNAENLTGTLVHHLTFGSLPALDGQGRPLFAHGERIHDSCERRAHFDAGQFAEEFGDEGYRKGWCLYKLGCKGPSTFHNCGLVRWNGGTSWPIQAGHPCVGCSEPHFWDSMGPLYERLPSVPGFGVGTTADRVGVGIAAGTAMLFAGHGVGKMIQRRAARRAAGRPTGAPVEEPRVPAPASPQAGAAGGDGGQLEGSGKAREGDER
jgi:hydrogenase small subunit